MKKFGTHYIVDGWLAPWDVLNNKETIRLCMQEAVRDAGATLIDLCVHCFSPLGVTATATLAESHIALHTWPEEGYFAADFFFCGSGNPDKALRDLVRTLGAREYRIREIVRGQGLERECTGGGNGR